MEGLKIYGRMAKIEVCIWSVDKKIPLELKEKIYCMIVRPTLMYNLECWPIKKVQTQRLVVAEIRMIRWMCCHIRLDMINSEVFRGQ